MKSFGLAIVLSSLGACSGSIFSESGATPPPPAPGPAPSENRPLAQGDSNSSTSSDGPGRHVGVVPKTDPSLDKSRRSVIDVKTLEIFEILAPSKVNEWTEKMNDRQRKDFLAQLSLKITIDKSVKHGEHSVRTVNFYISKSNKNVSLAQPNAPWVSVSMEVNKDEIEEGMRAVYLSGYLQSADYPTSESPFIALSLKFKQGKDKKFYLYDGKFIEYENGDPKPGYRISNNSNIKLSIVP